MHRYIACGAYGKNLEKFRARCHARCLGAPPRAAAARARCPDAGIKPRPDPPRRRFAPRRVRPHFPPPRPAKSAAPGPAGRCPAAPRPATPHRTTGAEGGRRGRGRRKERKEEGGRRLPSRSVPGAIFPVFPSRRRLCRQGIMMCHCDCRPLSRCDCRPSSHCDCRPSSRCDCRPSCRCFLQVLETSPCRGGAAKI